MKEVHVGVPTVAQKVKNLTSIYEDVGSIPGFVQQVKDPESLQAVLWQMRLRSCVAVTVAQSRQLQLQFDPQPGNFRMLKKKKERKKERNKGKEKKRQNCQTYRSVEDRDGAGGEWENVTKIH